MEKAVFTAFELPSETHCAVCDRDLDEYGADPYYLALGTRRFVLHDTCGQGVRRLLEAAGVEVEFTAPPPAPPPAAPVRRGWRVEPAAQPS